MGTTPAQFFETFVVGNFEDFCANSGCVRRGFNAAVSAAHLADHYLQFNQRHNADRVKAFSGIHEFAAYIERKTDGAFRDVRSVSNAYKHLYTDTKPRFAASSSVTSSGTVEVVFVGDGAELQSVETHFLAGGGEDDHGHVIFTRKDGSQGDLLAAIRKVVEFWQVAIRADDEARA